MPQAHALLVLGFPDVAAAGDAAAEVIRSCPLAVEGLDHRLLAAVPARGGRLAGVSLPDGNAWLLVEMGGESPAEATERARDLAPALHAQRSVRRSTSSTTPSNSTRCGASGRRGRA